MLKIALGGVTALTLVVMLTIWHSPSPVVEETWRDAALPLVFKSAALASITAPKIVQVEPVKVESDVVTLPDPPESKPVELDVRRGKGKRYHGRSWKCRR